MMTKKRFSELSYNTQLTTDKNQIIIANDLCQDKHDANQFIPQIKNVRENIELDDDTKVGLDCGYSSGDNIHFAKSQNLDLYVPSRALAQVLDGKEQTLNHDNYVYDEKSNEIIVDGHKFAYRGMYTRKSGKKIHTFY